MGATAAMAGGFVAVFTVFGMLTVSAASTVQRYLPFVTVILGAGLLVLGVLLTTGRHLGVLVPGIGDPRAPTARLGSMFGYGVGYAAASLSCTIGPFLAVTAAAFEGSSVAHGVSVYLAYAAGFTLVVGALAISTALASTTVLRAARRMLPYIDRIGGLLLIIVGGYVAHYGSHEIRLLHTGGNAHDPVIGAAGRIQGAVAAWVHTHGATPWLILAGGTVVCLVVLRIGRRFHAKRAKTTGTGDTIHA